MAVCKINKINIYLAGNSEEANKAIEEAADIYAKAIIRIIKQKKLKKQQGEGSNVGFLQTGEK